MACPKSVVNCPDRPKQQQYKQNLEITTRLPNGATMKIVKIADTKFDEVNPDESSQPV